MAQEIQRLVAVYEAETKGFDSGTAKVNAGLRSFENTTNKVSSNYIDASGKMREASGKFAKGLADDTRKITSEVENQKKAFGNFGGSFFGSLSGDIASSFISGLSTIPSQVGAVLDQAVKIAQDRQNAFKGLESIATFKGVSPIDAQAAVQGLRLVKAGIIDVGDATTGLKNLLATGFSLPQAITLLERFSDTAAFGKQSALSYGQAVSSATEGIKNQNSVLVDNAGVTKNLSVILKERGFELEDLSDKTKKQSAIEALYKGLVEETAMQVGDADKLTQGYTGSVASLDQAYKNLYGTVGNTIIQNADYIAANQILADQVKGLTSDLTDQGSETQKTATQWINFYAKVRAATFPFLSAIKNGFMGTLQYLSGAGMSLMGLSAAAIEGIVTLVLGGIAAIYNPAIDALNKARELTTGGDPLPKLEWNQVGKISFDAFQRAADMFSAGTESFGKLRDSTREMRGAIADVDTYSRAIREDAEKAKANIKKAAKPSTAGSTIGSPGGGGSGRLRKAKNTDSRDYRDIENFVREMGFTPGSGYRTEGTTGSHAAKIALDVKLGGKSEQEIAELVAAAIKKGFRVVDEREKIPGSPYWRGKHLHLETNDRRESTLNPNLGYGNIPIGYLRELDNERFTKERGHDPKEVAQFAKRSAEDAKKQEEVSTALAVLNNAQAVYGREAIRIPETTEDIIAAYKELRNATRQRIVRDTSERPRIANVPDPNAWQMQPGNEWGLQFQGDRSLERPRDVGGQVEAFNQFNASLTEQLELIQRGNRPFTEYELTQREIAKNFQNLDPLQRQDLLNTAAKIDAQDKLNRILGEQRTFNDVLEEAQAGLVQDTYNAINSGVDALISKMGLADTAVGNFFSTMLAGLARLAAQQAFGLLFGGGAGATGAQGSSGGWLSKLIGIGISAVGSLFGGGAGNAAGGAFAGMRSSATIGMASGGWVNARAGGHLINIGEGGYDEGVITTDPAHRNRTAKIINRVAESVNLAPNYALVGSTANNQAKAPAGNNITLNLVQNLKANENGNFSKQSAQQAATQAAAALEAAMRRK